MNKTPGFRNGPEATLRETLKRSGAQLPPSVMAHLLNELPTPGGSWTCGWCHTTHVVPEDYRGMWMECPNCGAV